jgi:hypothetical protein
LFEGSPETSSSSEWIKQTGPVSASVLFIVPRYVNRTKALEVLMNRFKNVTEGADIGKKISELRAEQLELKIKEIALAKTEDNEKENRDVKEDGEQVDDIPVKDDSTERRVSLFGNESTSESDSSVDPKYGDEENGSTKKLWD